MDVIETSRLKLRELTEADTAFVVQLLNEPDVIRYIGDHGLYRAARPMPAHAQRTPTS